MSALLLAATDTIPLAADDLFGTATNLTGKTGTLIGEAAGVLAMVFVLRHIIQSFTVVRLITALLLAGVMLWGVFHLKDLSNKADSTINGGGGGGTSTNGPAPAPTTVQLGQSAYRAVLPLE